MRRERALSQSTRQPSRVPAKSVPHIHWSVRTHCPVHASDGRSSSAGQEIPYILRTPKVHYRIHNSPPLVPILSQNDPVCASHPTSLRSTWILSSHLVNCIQNSVKQARTSPNASWIHWGSPNVCRYGIVRRVLTVKMEAADSPKMFVTSYQTKQHQLLDNTFTVTTIQKLVSWAVSKFWKLETERSVFESKFILNSTSKIQRLAHT